MARTRLSIDKVWNGLPAGTHEHAWIDLEIGGRSSNLLTVHVDAPFHGDPAPPGRPGPAASLWNFEVVELFLLGDESRYLELEFGPFGHYLALSLAGARKVVEEHEIEYAACRGEGRWRGHAAVGVELLPRGCGRVNAYAIHGVGDARRYLACHAVPGEAPDFHRLDCFGPWSRAGEVSRRP